MSLKGQYFRSEAFRSDGKKVKILGWGGIVDHANMTAQNSSCDLLEADMQVRLWIFTTHCLAQVDFRNHRCPTSMWSEKKLCIHHEDLPPANGCFGDSGGPLLLDQNGFAVVIGVTSYKQIRKCSLGDFKCMLDVKCDSESINIHTKVQAYLPWIKEITAQGKSKFTKRIFLFIGWLVTKQGELKC